MPLPTMTLGETVWDLPPLILHPFNERISPASLLENSKAALMLSGIIPSDGSDKEKLQERLMTGRYSELRMLFYIGKDVLRWIDQCLESAARVDELRETGIREQSFASLLSSDPPAGVKEKLVKWGVTDWVSIFRRSIGLHVIFAEPPALANLTPEFLTHYHRYADALFDSYMESEPYFSITPHNFHFELYASGEYSRMLESEWGTN